ncbi:hypothetical protein ACQ4PT_066609 [Festuca glaucescens]
MSVIPLPSTKPDRMNRPWRGMLWKGKATCSGGDCQVAWHDVCRSREEGGLSLLLKFVHKLLRGDDTPWARWVRRWYGLGGISSPPSPTDTPSWRAFKRVFATYRGLTKVKVGDDSTTSFWFDNWHAAGPLFARVPDLLSHCTDPAVTVAAALAYGHLTLSLHSRVTPATQAQLAALADSLRQVELVAEPDTRVLPGGVAFSTSSAYHYMHSSEVVIPLADFNWRNFAPLKVRVFFWIARHGNTKTRVLLHRHRCLPSL